jgi:serine protease
MKLIRYLMFCLLLVSGFSVTASDNRPQVVVEGIGTSKTLPGHILFKLTPEAAAKASGNNDMPETIRSLLQKTAAASPRRVFPAHQPPEIKDHPSGKAFSDLSRIFEVYVQDHERTESVIYSLAETGYAEYVQPRFLPQPVGIHPDTNNPGEKYLPNDTLLPFQYYLEKIAAFDAWAVWKGDTNTVIAIVDTGVDFLHPDLKDAIKYNYDDPINGMDADGDGYIDNFYGWDLGEGNNNPSYNKLGHGVHVSGIAAASADNVTGIAGVGFYSKFLPVKVDDEFGRLTSAYEGIVYAADQGASVINCSWGSFFNAGPFGQDVIDYAVLNHDALVVAAAGNANTSQPFYPASYQHVLSVAATDTLDGKTHFSSYGPFVDVSAPGVGILSAWINGTYIYSGGTSMAAPVVSGAAAIIRSYFPQLDAMQTKALIKMTADPVDEIEANFDFTDQLGFGRLNMYRALTETTHPYITTTDKPWDDDQMAMIRAGQEFDMPASFVNRLAPAENLYAIMTVNSEYLDVIRDSVWIGSLGTYEQTDGSNNPFVVRTLNSLPYNHEAVVTFRFYDGEKKLTGRKSHILSLNHDYVNVQAGRIATTISARGAIGFNYPNRNQGYGLRIDDGFTRIRTAGLIIANEENSVIDNVYGEEETSFSESIMPDKLPVLYTGEQLAPIIVRGSLQDDPMQQTVPLGLNIDYNVYFWDGEQAEDFFIIRYIISNQSSTTHKTLYAGFFADWLIRDIKLHRARFNASSRLAYAFAEPGEQFAGVRLLSFGEMFHYAFDNKGADESIKLEDGFSDEEKFLALTSDRPQAGFYGNDNDVSSLVSSGPHLLEPLETLEIAFSLHLADNQVDLEEDARRAGEIYLEMLKSEIETREGSFSVNPNPFTDVLNVYLPGNNSGQYVLSVYNLQGQRLKTFEFNTANNQKPYVVLPVSDLQPGFYLLQMNGPEINNAVRVLKMRFD